MSIAWLGCVVLALAGDENLLKNGDFEAGGKSDVALWVNIQPPGENAHFEHLEEGAHGGKRCAALSTTKGAGYSSFTQEILSPPKDATLVRLAGWIKAAELAEGGAGSLFLLIYDPDDDSKSAMHPSKSVTQIGEWTRVEVVAPVPEHEAKWLVRCGVSGVGKVLFDDVVLTASKGKRDQIALGQLAVHRGDYFIDARNATKSAWLRCSVPFPLGAQTPLALRVTSTPPNAVARLAFVAERENRPLEITLAPLDSATRVALTVETLVWLGEREPSDGVGIELAKKGKLPKEVALYLDDAPGVDVRDDAIVAGARQLARDDLAALMRDATKFLDERLEYAGGGPQGASECLKAKKAVCTGFANVATALLIAADVPTRTLACTLTSARSQEHYIVESWTPKLGWARMESTMAKFPWKESANLVVRVVHPDAQRSPADVPLYVEHSDIVEGGFDMGDDGCWQGGEQLGSHVLDAAEARTLESASRKAFEALVKQPSEGNRVRFAPASATSKQSSAIGALLDEVGRWLAR